MACTRRGFGSIPVRSNAASSGIPGEMLGSVRRSEMVEKSLSEELGSGSALGIGFCVVGEQGGWGSGGHLIWGLPGTNSRCWSEENRRPAVLM